MSVDENTNASYSVDNGLHLADSLVGRLNGNYKN